jgi:hypothetical protein
MAQGYTGTEFAVIKNRFDLTFKQVRIEDSYDNKNQASNTARRAADKVLTLLA